MIVISKNEYIGLIQMNCLELTRLANDIPVTKDSTDDLDMIEEILKLTLRIKQLKEDYREKYCKA